jgi:hypothetical protein
MAYELRLTLGLIVRGPADSIQILVPAIEEFLAHYPTVRVLAREISDRRVWLNVGRDPEGTR